MDCSHINNLLFDRNSGHTRIERLGKKDIKRLEVQSRQANLKFLGLHEPGPRHNRTDVYKIVDTLNYFSSNTTWRHIDIENVHSLGRAPKHSQQRGYHQHERPRPLIVTFSHRDDKISILRDRDLRERLRRDYIRATTAVTPRQRQPLQRYEQRGIVAYYKNGRLHVETGRTIEMAGCT